MNLFQILETTCSTDVSSCCSDYGIAMFLYVLKQALTLIQFAVPIILIVMGVVQLTKMMITPDDKKSMKSLINKFIAAIFIFFTPLIINLILTALSEAGTSFEIASCWESAEGIAEGMKNGPKYTVKHTDKRVKVFNTEKYAIIKEKDVEEGKATSADSSSTAGQKIVDYALQFVGNPYVWQGASLTSGCDCSHFVYLVLKDVGAYDGDYRTSTLWAGLGKEVKGGLKNAQAGDVVVYSGHVGIYDGKKYLIEAKSSKEGITHNRRPEDRSGLIAVRRFV